VPPVTGGHWEPGDEAPAAGGWGSGRSAQRFLQFFNKITDFYAYFGKNSYFKAIIHQLKAI